MDVSANVDFIKKITLERLQGHVSKLFKIYHHEKNGKNNKTNVLDTKLSALSMNYDFGSTT